MANDGTYGKFNARRGRCYYCNDPIDEYSATKDHVIPRVDGGILSNDNKVFCCQECNRLKGDKHPVEFLEYLQFNRMTTKMTFKKQVSRIEQMIRNTRHMVKILEGNGRDKRSP